jgi:hypothetical protein
MNKNNPVSTQSEQTSGIANADTTPSPESAFRKGRSFGQLMQEQGVKPVSDPRQLLGGWPEDELDDGFEQTIRAWRQNDVLTDRES